jgi:hypothetical protein
MDIQINSFKVDLLVQTVIVTHNIGQTDSLLFRCYHCGTAISRIDGTVIRIEAGYPPSDYVPVIDQCHNCHENYIFRNGFTKPTATEIILAPEPGKVLSTFHCMRCRTPILEYDKLRAVSLTNYKVLKLPFFINCPKPDCGHTYLIKEIVSLDP